MVCSMLKQLQSSYCVHWFTHRE